MSLVPAWTWRSAAGGDRRWSGRCSVLAAPRISAQANTPGSAPAGIWENKFGLSGKQIRRRYFPLQRRLYRSAALCEAHGSSVSSFLFGPFVNYCGGYSLGPLSIVDCRDPSVEPSTPHPIISFSFACCHFFMMMKTLTKIGRKRAGTE